MSSKTIAFCCSTVSLTSVGARPVFLSLDLLRCLSHESHVKAIQPDGEYGRADCVRALLGCFRSGHSAQSRTHERCQVYLTAE
jgi:hypothetical protein